MKYLILFFIVFNAYAKTIVLSPEDSKMLEKISSLEKEKNKEIDSDRKIYRPAPQVRSPELQGYLVERDSSKIVHKKMSQDDTLNIKMCYSSGVSVGLDDNYRDEFQRVILDDVELFEAKQFDNNKGVLVRLKAPVNQGVHWESALRLVTKSNDKTFLINLIGVACPQKGPNPFPKVYYIQPKTGLLNANSNIMTPEDTIIYASEGLPRVNKYPVRVYDMVASSNSDWVFFGIELQYPDPNQSDSHIVMKVLDNLQVNLIPSKAEVLDLSSKKATEAYGVSTLRFRLAVNLDKTYLMQRRYVYLMILDKHTKHYQYIEVDLLPYFHSLKERDFNL